MASIERQSPEISEYAVTSYIELFSPVTYAAFFNEDRHVARFTEEQLAGKTLNPGDLLFGYVTKRSSWAAIREVVGEPYSVGERDTEFPIHIAVRPKLVLPLTHAVDVHSDNVFERLSFTAGTSGSDWTHAVRKTLTQLDQNDAELLTRVLDDASILSRRLLICRIGWMEHYDGPDGDPITGGGAFVDKHDWGEEVFNFKDAGGHCYGYVRPPRGNAKGDYIHPRIKVDRIAKPDGRMNAEPDEFQIGGGPYVDNVLVVWTAQPPGTGEQRVLGWYQNARVYGHAQPADESMGRTLQDPSGNVMPRPYYATCSKQNATLLPIDARTFRVPRGKGWFGQANLLYAEQPHHAEFRRDLLLYISSCEQALEAAPSGAAGKPSFPRHPDVERRRKIEDAAIQTATEHYKNDGYTVQDRGSENLGYDLEAKKHGSELHVEVKGRGGGDASAMLSPNEYDYLLKKSSNYRLFIVTDALAESAGPHSLELQWDANRTHLVSRGGQSVAIAERTAATVTVAR